MRGLHGGKCIIHEINNISESIKRISQLVTEYSVNNVMVVADVQAGGFVLLALLNDAGIRLSNTMFFNSISDDIQSVIRAIQMHVKDYLIQDDPPSHRELRSRMMVEEMIAKQALNIVQPYSSTSVPVIFTAGASKETATVARASETAAPAQKRDIVWDPETHFIYYGNDQMLHLSPTEGKVFGLLYMNRKNVVYTEKIVKQCLGLSGVDRKTGTKLLRPHVMRLRRKLNHHSMLAGRIINVRTTGYMFA